MMNLAEIESTLSEQRAPSADEILHLQAAMVQGIKDGSMVKAEMVTDHYFVPGMYCRRVWRQAGTRIVGKAHKAPHFFMCASGEIMAWTESGMHTLRAGDVIECKPGTKRVTFAVQDSIGITIHKTEHTDLDEIEAELIEPDDAALFDSSNTMKLISTTEMKELP